MFRIANKMGARLFTRHNLLQPLSATRAFAAQQPTSWNCKIVCTIGPASSSDEVLEQMILAGMDVCRLNFSHGEYGEHQETFDKIRRLGEKYGNQIAVLCDIQGPKIRTGKMKEPFEVAVGDKIRVTPDDVVGTPQLIQISYKTLGKIFSVFDA